MNLLLDIGNTSLRWARQEPGQPPAVLEVVRHGGGLPPDLLAAWEALEPPARVLASQVGDPALRAVIARVTRALWGQEPVWAAPRAETLGVRIAYVDPARFGVDRWLALLATHDPHGTDGPRPALILDAGTAATFDLLDADGQHLGGLILPGLAAMRAALRTGAHLPALAEPRDVPPDASDAMDTPDSALPVARDTHAAVMLGAVQALGALASRLHDRLAARTGVTPRLLLTGGDAESLRAALERPCEPVPDLVLRGLARLADAGAL